MSNKNDDYIKYWRGETHNREALHITIEDISVVIPPGVFNPSAEVTYSSTFLLKNIPEDLTGKKILDMGTGSGIIAIKAAKQGAKHVVAIDIDKKAHSAASNNAKLNGCPDAITMVWSDLFHNVPAGRFDLILANLPILDTDFESIYPTLMAKYDSYLKDNGELWVLYASFGDLDKSEKLLDQHSNLKEKLIENQFDIDWYLYKFSK